MTAEELRQRMSGVKQPLSPSPSHLSQGPVPLLVFGAVALYFWGNFLFLPLRLLVVTFHELGHALVALLTGGEVLSIQVNIHEGGLTQSVGGWQFLILNGGYLGSLCFGLLLLLLAKKPGRGKLLSFFLGIGLLLVGALWVPLSFGLAYVLLSGLSFLYLSRRVGADLVDFLVRGIGLFSVFYALFDIRSDVFSGGGISDASMLAELTGIPAVLWGVGWLAVSVALLWVLRRRIL